MIKKARGRKYLYYEELRKQCSEQRKPQVKGPGVNQGKTSVGSMVKVGAQITGDLVIQGMSFI